MEVHAPHVIGEIVEVFELILQEREKNCAVKQTNDQKTRSSSKTINCKQRGRQHDKRERKEREKGRRRRERAMSWKGESNVDEEVKKVQKAEKVENVTDEDEGVVKPQQILWDFS